MWTPTLLRLGEGRVERGATDMNHPFRSAGVVGTARKEGDTGNRGRPVAGEGSGLNVTSGGGSGGKRKG